MHKASAMLRTVALSALLALPGCASKNPTTTADLMLGHAEVDQSQADLKAQLARDWKSGKKLVGSGEKWIDRGQKRLEAAERDLKRAQEEIERGNREVAEGQQLIQESERRFREAFPDLKIKPAADE